MKRELLVTDRRKFLGFLSGTSLMFLPILRTLRADTPTDLPKRAFFLVQTNGGIVDTFSPTGSQQSFELSATLAPLEPYKSQLNVFDGLFVADGEHYGQSHLRQLHGALTGQQLQNLVDTAGYDFYPMGPSIDQAVGATLGTKVLSLGKNNGITYNLVSWLDAGTPAVPMSPVQAFDYVFGEVTSLDDVPSAQQAEYLERLRAEKKSVLDLLYREFDGLKPNLSAAERSKLELHMEGLRAIEMEIDGLALPACTLPTREQFETGSGIAEVTRAHLDLAFVAMQCGLSDVATVLPVGAGSWGSVFSFLGYPDDNHEMSHRTKAEHYDQQTGVQAWYIEQLAYFVAKLAAVPEGDGTMLDNTICMYTTEMGDGSPHNYVNLQTVLCGNVGGYFQTGQYLAMERSNTGVLSAIAEAFGHAAPFGDPSFAEGPFAEIVA
ncbi:MAG TPA: DUF1552 domain-containing protein [Nannocystaceae bacterium]|nr:DUF1552 domain-containing protein [Nannocystaceae bacterium]